MKNLRKFYKVVGAKTREEKRIAKELLRLNVEDYQRLGRLNDGRPCEATIHGVRVDVRNFC